MADLTASGINFSNGTFLNSKYNIIPLNSISVFYQANAPTGWNRITTYNDAALRIVSGTGGGAGGSIGFLSAFPTSLRNFSGTASISGFVGNTTLAWPQMPSHAHPNGCVNSINTSPAAPSVNQSSAPINTGSAGGDQPHAHPWSGSGTFSTSLDFRCQYIDVLLCQFVASP